MLKMDRSNDRQHDQGVVFSGSRLIIKSARTEYAHCLNMALENCIVNNESLLWISHVCTGGFPSRRGGLYIWLYYQDYDLAYWRRIT